MNKFERIALKQEIHEGILQRSDDDCERQMWTQKNPKQLKIRLDMDDEGGWVIDLFHEVGFESNGNAFAQISCR